MKILLDTHILLWWLDNNAKLSDADLKMILEQLPKNDFQELASHSSHILALSTLPLHHKDPFDRMLIAQAKQESLVLMTHDKTISYYDKSIMLV